MTRKTALLWICALILAVGCRPKSQLHHTDARIIPIATAKLTSSPVMDSFLSPYRANFKKKMSDTLAFNDLELVKGKPNGLGIWVVQALTWYTDSVIKTPVDIAVCNSGGIRIKSLSSGAITLSQIFELMPFDNGLVIIELDSLGLDSLAIAAKNGWPKSHNFSIKGGSSGNLNWSISKKANSPLFRLVISDYLANGGDKLYFLARYQHQKLPILFRDVLIAYARHQQRLKTYTDNSASYGLTDHQ